MGIPVLGAIVPALARAVPAVVQGVARAGLAVARGVGKGLGGGSSGDGDKSSKPFLSLTKNIKPLQPITQKLSKAFQFLGKGKEVALDFLRSLRGTQKKDFAAAVNTLLS